MTKAALPGTEGIKEIAAVAYMHPTCDMVTTDPAAYTGLQSGSPRELVLKSAVIDHIDRLERSIDEWRTYATEAGRQLAAARKEIERLKADKPAAKTSTPGFDEFWAAWPTSSRKVNKKACLTRWISADLEPSADSIVAHVKAMTVGRDWTKEGGAYIPAPLVYLNQERYLAPPSPVARQSGSLAGMNYKPTGVDADGHFN